jgi:RimJ/RimL family protein N-acetyltransferase
MSDACFTELVSERIVLRRFAAADLADFVRYRSHPEVARYQTWDAPYPQSSGERLISGLAEHHPDTPGEWFQYAMILRSSNELIGDYGSATDAEDPRLAEIGFTLSVQHQGHGYANEGARALLDYLFGDRGKHRVSARCDPRNTASQRLLERIGMRMEGHLRQNSWAKGEWTDELLYAMLDYEWAERR